MVTEAKFLAALKINIGYYFDEKFPRFTKQGNFNKRQ